MLFLVVLTTEDVGEGGDSVSYLLDDVETEFVLILLFVLINGRRCVGTVADMAFLLCSHSWMFLLLEGVQEFCF